MRDFLGVGGLRVSDLPTWTTPWLRWIAVPIYIGCALAFVADISHDITVSFGLFYIPLVCTAVLHRNRDAAWWLAGVAILLTVIGFFFPIVNANLVNTLINRSMSILVIGITAVLVRHMRAIQDELSEQREHIAEIERTKSEVFTNLGQELRMPLHSIVGISELMMLGCREDQRQSLALVKNGGRRLLTTIENLIDLTHLDEQTIRAERLDLTQTLAQILTVAAQAAEEQHIELKVDTTSVEGLFVLADSWATRRILGNILDNAIRFSKPGGTVTIVGNATGDHVTITIEDRGVGMPPSILRRLGQPFMRADSDTGTGAGTGIALSRRLAHAIGAELSFASQPGMGTTVTLSLRQADQASR